MNFERMRTELARKVGPLPLGGWLAIAAVGVAAAIIIRRRLAANSAASSAEPALVGPDGERLDASAIASYTPGGFVVGGGPATATGGTPNDPTVTDPPTPLTNSDWSAKAISYLLSRGYQGTIVVDGVERFLSGGVLTTQQQAMIDQALAAVGPPPQPVPPPVVTPEPLPVGGSGGGGGTITPAPAPAPAPAPQKPPPPTPYPTRPFRILRYNGGPDGPGSFVAVFVGTNGVMGWIPDGNVYAGFTSEFPVTTLSETAFVAAVNAAPHYGPAPRWLPPGARW